MQARPYLKAISLKEDMITDWDKYPFNIPAIRNINTLQFHSGVTFFVGENGAGKSTLIESIALAMGFSSEGGTRNFNLATADTISTLHRYLKTIRSFATPKDYYFLRAESFYNVATYMDQVGGITSGYGDKLLHERSHGEAFMAALTLKLRGKGLYIFDEPEAALSPTRQMAAISAIHQLVKKESQFIIATHSPILLSYPDAKILHLDEHGISEISYEETEHFSITRSFLNNYKKLLPTLLED
ncbi:AAA family ATPase [Trichlorobacter lovleyi]|uniref:SMC domain protein n=1 Tax=Trichlorobacter lovleyi (strain ATCC BAA-1151 / DSM 17278 / SZ) TaxID=398767 RepID=B3E2B1_TRIL1|nr:AAA family ATPase [Trichlorobacter lovleyi]ACD94164.1 SMC domain protein [Trichlorobacter lovleyi SZ]